MDTPSTAPTRSIPWRSWARGLKIALVAVFIVWHLFFLVFRGAYDLWADSISDWKEKQPRKRLAVWALVRCDRVTKRYGTFFGIEQGWSLFAGPLAQSAPFLTARIEFTDGSAAWVYSENEPDPRRFFRAGGWRQRKLEEYLTTNLADDLAQSRDLPVWSAFARWCQRRWHAANPDDRRQPARIVLLTRTIKFPGYDADPCAYEEPETSTIATFDPDGRLP